MNELEALVLLTTIPYLGSVKIRFLIQHFGSALEAARATPNELSSFTGFGPKILDFWRKTINQPTWHEQLTLAQKYGAKLIPYTDPAYPKRLLEINDYPLILYVKGSLLKADKRSLAVIGTRQASIYGLEMARKIGQELARAGITVISGFARGIDTAAHEGALTSGGNARTIGVLGSGIGHLYPKENSSLAERLIQQGALISECPILTPPERRLFPRRNRIVCGMTMGTVVIEAPTASGAMITAYQALNANRPVFALPGRADNENFRGNHELIKQGKAKLIENTQDILTSFDELLPISITSPLKFAGPHLEPEEKNLLEQLPFEEFSIERIVEQTHLPMSKLNVLLMSLVLKKIIKEFPGKIYRKI